jgi:hypothetical protein
MEVPRAFRVSFQLSKSHAKSEEKTKPPNTRRRMTKYIQIKSFIKNNELSEYKQFVDLHERKIKEKIDYFYGPY